MRAVKYIFVGLLGVAVITFIGSGIGALTGVRELGRLICFFGGMPWGMYLMHRYVG